MDFAPSPATAATAASSDLADLPALSHVTPRSNTLLITDLTSRDLFTPAHLERIKQAIAAQAPIHTFAPLRALQRIIVVLYSDSDAATVRHSLENETLQHPGRLLGAAPRIFFGVETRIHDVEDQHLQAPRAQKMFFISPPPSPPVGWEMRDEDPPNKAVHADDLLTALAQLSAREPPDDEEESGTQQMDSTPTSTSFTPNGRQRSSTLVYDPSQHGHSPALPIIAVEDAGDDDATLDVDGETKFHHTSRPPVELMET